MARLNEPVRDPTEKPSSSKRERAWPLFAVLAFGALLILVVAILLGGTPRQDPAGDERSGAAKAPPAGIDLEHPSLGDEDAPVVMVEYADFQCPYCKKFARDVRPELVEKYVEDGTLRIEWRDFPYLGQKSVNAALAARAAQEQGRFWEYHDLLFENQGPANGGAFADDNLVRFAQELGLDAERFESGLKGGNFERVVSEDFQEGLSREVTGTPTFDINGETLTGTQPVETFEEAIEEAAREDGVSTQMD